MLPFEVGTHLLMEVVEEDGLEIVGGHLAAASEFGVTLSTTHQVKTVVPEVTEIVRAAIREAVEKLPRFALRVMAAVEVESLQALYKLTREDQIKVVCFAEERKYVQDNTRQDLVKLDAPVLTFYAGGDIHKAEVTEDFNVMVAMGRLDGVLGQITAKAVKDGSNSDETGKDKDVEPEG